MNNYTLVIHGGAGNIHPGMMDAALEKEYQLALQKALHEGYQVLEQKGAALDAVAAAIVALENNPLFNAGKGAVFSNAGKNEMDNLPAAWGFLCKIGGKIDDKE